MRPALDPLDVRARLDDLRALSDGWLDGTGVAPPHAGLDWLASAFDRHFPDDLPLPHLYPTPEGGFAPSGRSSRWNCPWKSTSPRERASGTR